MESTTYGVEVATEQWHDRAVTPGESVAQRRKAAGLNQDELARAATVNKGTVVRIERDDESVKPRTLRKVLQALSRFEADLLGQGAKAPSLPTEEGAAHAPTAIRHEELLDRITYFANEIIIAVGRARDLANNKPAGTAVTLPAKSDRPASAKKRRASGGVD